MNPHGRMAVVAVCAVLLQTAVLDRLPVPGGTGPDLLLIVVAGVALKAGATSGAVCGFACGLALGVLPPAEMELGRQAVVLCLVGFLAGRLAPGVRRSPPLAFGVVAAAVPFTALLHTALGVALSDPRAGLGSTVTALPAALSATMLLSPFVLYALHRVLGRAAEEDDAYAGAMARTRGRLP